MSILPMHLIRHGLVLLGTVASVGCTSEGDGVTNPGSIALSLSQNSATVEQGGSQTVTATLTRFGGFSGTVNLTVTGAESGITATVSNVQTSGSVTTATVTILAGDAVPGEYRLVVHGTGSSVGEVTQVFTLTVPVGLGFSISLSESALSIVQGASTPTTTVSITRFGQAASVGLYVTGLPAGVTDSFDPKDWPAESSTVLTLTVSATAAPGSYNLQVNAYDPEQEGEVSAPLTLTVTVPSPGPPGYTLSLSASTFSIAQNAWSPSTTVLLARSNFTGNVTLSVDSLPTGVTAVFYPVNPTSGSSSRFWLSVAPNAVPGTYPNLQVRGVASGLADRTAPLTLTITITKTPFILTLSSSTLSIAQGASMPTTTVNLLRQSYTGPVSLYVISYDDHVWYALPPGVTAAFSHNPATGDSSVLTLSVDAATVPGVYYLRAGGEASTEGWCCVPLTLTVTARAP